MKLSILAAFLLLLMVQPLVASAGCTCDADSESEDRNRPEALKFKLIAVGSILAAGTLGVLLPIMGRRVPSLNPENVMFSLIKAFSAGVILATGFIHVLSDAFQNLTSPCLAGGPWDKFPFTGLIAMAASIGTLIIDTFATSYYKRAHFTDKATAVTRNAEISVHNSAFVAPGEAHDVLRHRIIVTQVLELGIMAHSVIIGLSLGASESPSTLKPLIAAVSFHQLFEGMGLGGCVSRGTFKSKSIATMVFFFSVTTPFGIVLGMVISNGNSPRALAVEGSLNAATSGILIYMALVDLLAADFINSKMTNNLLLQIGATVSLLLGSAFMSILAIWA